MQKGTVIDAQVMHRLDSGSNTDGAKPSGGSSAQNRKNASPDPARNPKRENGHAAAKDKSASDGNRSNPCRTMTRNTKGAAIHARRFPKSMARIMSCAAAVLVAAVMTISLGGFAGEALNASGAIKPLAYASTATTPYTNIDVPLNGSNGNNTSDNANPDRVETDDGNESEGNQRAGILGPYLDSASSRADSADSADAGETNGAQSASEVEGIDSSDDSTITKNHLTYKLNESASEDDLETYTLTYVDPKAGKVVSLPSDVTTIAEGAFIDCADLETIIVFGKLDYIAKAERDFFGNATRQGAFTDEQLKEVHVVFAVNPIHDESFHKHDHDSEGAGDEGVNESEADGPADDEPDDTPVAQGIKRLSGDMVLVPAGKSSKQNIWVKTGFQNVAAAPEIGERSNPDNDKPSGATTDEGSGFIFTVLSDCTLEVAWNSDVDMPNDLAIPDYGQVDGTIYNVTQIAEGAFKNINAFQTLAMEDGITTIGDSAFENCAGLTEVTLPDTLESIGDSAFKGTGIATIEIPDTVTKIGAYAFANCPNLQQVTQKTTEEKLDGGTGAIDAQARENADTNEEQEPDSPTPTQADAADPDQTSPEGEYGLDGHAAKAVNATAFEGTSAQVDNAVYRTVYADGGNRIDYANHVRINPNGGTWAAIVGGEGYKYNGYHYASEDDLWNGKKTRLVGKTDILNFYFGLGGYLHLTESYEDVTRTYWNNNWTSANGERRDEAAFFTATKKGYEFLYLDPTTPENVKESVWCEACDNRTIFTGQCVSSEGKSRFKIEWNPIDYVIRYEKNKPSGASKSVTGYMEDEWPLYDESIQLLANEFKLSGWTFNGWNTKADGSGTPYKNNAIVKNLSSTQNAVVKLYAQWTRNAYTIYLNPNGGSVSPTTKSATMDSAYPTLPTPSRPNYTFQGWYTASTGGTKITGGSTKFTAAKNQTLYAHWDARNVSVTLNGNGGAPASQTISVKYGSAYSSLSNATTPSLDGSTFAGWYTSATGGSRVYTTTKCTNGSNHSLYAHWIDNAIPVTLNLNGGYVANEDGSSSGITSLQINAYKDQPYSELGSIDTSTLSKTGSSFAGWYTSPSGGSPVGSGTVCTKESPHTIYAHWNPISYTVTLDGNGGTPESQTINVTYGGAYSSLNGKTATLFGYEFVGWFTDPEEGAQVTSGSVCTTSENHTLWAHWREAKYTVVYNGNKPWNASHSVSGSMGNTSHIYGVSSRISWSGFSLTGWYQNGWNTDPNGRGTYVGNYASISTLANPGDTVVLYAQWIPNTYYVTYSSGFSTSSYPNSTLLFNNVPSSSTMPTSTFTYDSSYQLRTNQYGITGYDFDGWVDGIGRSYSQSQWVSNLTSSYGGYVYLSAKWRIHTYNIDIITVGGKMSAATPTSYTINDDPIYIGEPTKTGYDFWGWEVTGAGPYGRTPILNTDPAQIPTGTYGNLAFTAGWGEIEYTVVYNFNGGIGNHIDTQHARYNEPFTVAIGTDVISRDGYTFSGLWNTFADGSGDTYREGAEAMNLSRQSGGTAILYAMWNANEYDLTLDAAGGTLPYAANWTYNDDKSTAAKEVAFDSRIGTLLVPTRAGYEFAGWYNELGENVTSTTVYSVAAPMTLTARWTPYVYDVYFDKNAVGATGSMEPLQFYYGAEKPLTPNNFKYTGHTFLGWSRLQGAATPDFEDGESVSSLTDVRNGIVFLYAVWSENRYAISYYANGADVADGYDEPHVQEDIPYTKGFYPPTAESLGYTRTGYEFAGWSKAEGGDPDGLYKPIETYSGIAGADRDGERINLFAQWTPIEYRLKLDATGGTFDQTLFQAVGQIWSPETKYVGAYRQIKFDESYQSTIEPTRTGYDFAGWYPYEQKDRYAPGPQADRVSASDPYKALGDTVLYAHWDPHVYTLNLAIYNAYTHKDDILLIRQLRFNEGFALPHREYEFTEEDGATALSAGKQLSSFRMSGYALAGWSNTAADTKAYYGLGEEVFGLHPGVSSADTTDPAVFTLYLIQTSGSFTVEFDPNVPEGEEIQNPMLPPKEPWRYNTDNPVPTCTMKRPGYSFTYWTGPDGIDYYPGTTQRINVSADLDLDVFVLTANWVANTVDIFFVDTGDVKSVLYDSPAQTIRGSSTKELAAEMHCVFEGWWTMKEDSFDEMYFGLSGQINTKIPQISPKWRDPGEKNSGGGNNRVYLYAKWTFQVTFDFSEFGGEDPAVKPQNYTAGLKYGDESNANNYYPSHGLPTPKYNGLDSSKDEKGAVRRFAGWYTEPVGGELVTDDSYALGPVEKVPGQGIENVVLYARWYVDVTLDYPIYAPYTDGWAFEYGRDLVARDEGGKTVVSYVQGIPYRGDASFQLGLPLATRAGYGHLGWNADGRKAIYAGDTDLFDGEIKSSDIVNDLYNYTIYIEYAKCEVDVTVRYWQQVIEGVDADGEPSTGLTPSILSDAQYTSNGHYRLVEADTDVVRLFSEDQIDKDAYHEDPATDGGRYRGFTYHSSRVEKDMNRAGQGEPVSERLLIWDDETTPAQAREDLYDGCVAGDGTSVVDVFYTRNRYDVVLDDFRIIDGAALTQVRGSANVRAMASGNVAYSPAEVAGIPGRATSAKAWFEEEITLTGTSWAGYDFSGWDIAPTELGFSRDVENDHPETRLEGDVYRFAMTDSDIAVTPRCIARTDTPYQAILHYQNLISATSVEADRGAWARSAPITLYGTTDALTDWVVRTDAADAGAENVIENKAVQPADFDITGFPADVAFEDAYVFDPAGFTGAEAQNPVIRAERAETLHVYYARDSYPVAVRGYEAAHKDGTGAGDIGRINGYLWDEMTHGPVAADAAGGSAGTPVDAAANSGDAADPNATDYRIYFYAPISVVAVPAAGTELLGYTSSHGDIWETKTLSLYALDRDIALDANVAEDSAGLANRTPGNPYTFKYAGTADGHHMPVVPKGADGAQETLALSIQGQPARTSYEVVTMLQDTDSETDPAYGSYTRREETKAFDSVTTDEGTRLLRLWQDGTYVEANQEDTGYVPSITGFGLTDSYTPALFGYELYNGRGIVDLLELTPDGNAGAHGDASAPRNKAYVYMDRNKPLTVSYRYVVDGAYEAELTESVMATLPPDVESYFGATVRVAADPHANGWEFLGWAWRDDPNAGRGDYPDVGAGTDSESIVIPDSDVEITGTWAPRKYALEFEGGSAYGESPAENIPEKMTVAFNTPWTVPADVPKRNGYEFLGWTFADPAWDARLGDQPTMTPAEAEAYRQALGDVDYFGGTKLLLQPGEVQSPWGFYQEDGRTLNAVWMRCKYDFKTDLGEGSWPTGADIPLDEYMTGGEVPIPVPTLKGHMFTHWTITCAGTGTQDTLEPFSYREESGQADLTHATLNKWTWGDITLVANYDVLKLDVELNGQGGTFDGGYAGVEDKGITARYPDETPYNTATLTIPYGTDIDENTPLPEPTRPGYEFTGWVDATGAPIGYSTEYDEGGNPVRVPAPYTFDPDTDTVWVATWKGITYAIEYVWDIQGQDANGNNLYPDGAHVDHDKFTSAFGHSPDEFAADMLYTSGDKEGASVSVFELPTIAEIEYEGTGYSFEGWYPTNELTPGTGLRSFDPADYAERLAKTDGTTLTLYAMWSKGTVPFKEKFWLEVLDLDGLGLGPEWTQADNNTSRTEIAGVAYVAQHGRVYMCDEALTLERTGEIGYPVSTQGMAPAGYVFDDDTDNYRSDCKPLITMRNDAEDYVVNGFYDLERKLVRVGDGQTGIDAGKTHATVTSGATPIWDTDTQGWLNSDGQPWAPGDGDRYVIAPYNTDVEIECVPEPGYEFASWVPSGSTPSDLDVFDPTASFKMPAYDVSLSPYAQLISYHVFCRDSTGAELSGIAQTTYTVKDEFALKNLDADLHHGFTFDKWVAHIARYDEDAGRWVVDADAAVPETVGYDETQTYMRVRQGTTGDLIFTAAYITKEYTVTIEVPAEAKRDADGYPVGLERDPRLEWSVELETGNVSFTYTPETVGAADDPIKVDLKAIDAHPYKVDGWTSSPDEGNDEGDNPPALIDGAIVIAPDTTGSASVTPDGTTPKAFELIVDPNQGVPEGYEVDKDEFADDMQRLIDEIAAYDSPDKPTITDNGDGTWTIGFDVESAPQITLPKPVLTPKDGTDPNTEPDFVGWADNADRTNPALSYQVPGADLTNFEEGEPVKAAPVWVARDAGNTLVVVHLPDSERGYHGFDEASGAANEWTYAFAGTPLSETKDAYAADEAFNAKLTPTDGYHLGYHLEWYGFDEAAGAPSGERLPSLPANFPADGATHVCGVWAQDDDIKPVGFNNVSFGTSGPPGWSPSGSRAAYALTRSAYAAVTYYYKASIGLVVKDEANDTFVKVDYIDEFIMSQVEQYLDAGWLFDGYYLEGDADKDIIIDGTGKVDQALLQAKTQNEEIDLSFTDSWTRKQLVKIDFVGGTGDEAVTDATLYWWPDLDVFISPDNPAIASDDRKSGINGTIERKNTLIELADQGLDTPGPRMNDEGGEDAFLGYFGRDHLGRWPKDGSGNPMAAASVERFGAIGVTESHLDTYAYTPAGSDTETEIVMPYGYDFKNNPYDATAPGFYEIKWEAKWQGDLDAIYFNATVPMSMSFMIRADGAVFGPDAGAYQIRNYSNCAISVEDMSFAWSEEGLASLFGEGGTGAITLTAKPTDGQAYSNAVTLSKQAAEEGTGDDGSTELVSRYVFADADKWVIAKSVGVDPDGFTDNASTLPALKLDYGLSTGGVKPITFEGGQTDTAHPIGTLKFTLKTAK